MWGPIFTEQQIWDLVAYIYSFQFEYQHYVHEFFRLCFSLLLNSIPSYPMSEFVG
jgi:hypothetical protein